VLPEGARSIKGGSSQWDSLFNRFNRLKKVRGKNIRSIGKSAFAYCYTLTAVDFPAAETIGAYAFFSCAALKIASFPKAAAIQWQAFLGCTALITANFPAVETIGDYAFLSCPALKTVNIPQAGNIGYIAFGNCGENLKSITLGADLWFYQNGNDTPRFLAFIECYYGHHNQRGTYVYDQQWRLDQIELWHLPPFQEPGAGGQGAS
jgi:hypothetical protein